MITLRVLQGCRWNFVKFIFSTSWIVLKGGIGLLDFRTFELSIAQDPQGSTQMGYISCFHLLPIFRKILSSKWTFQSNNIIPTQPQSGTKTKMNLLLLSKKCFEKSFPNWFGFGEAVGNFLLPKRRSGIEWPQRCPSTPEWCRRPGPMMSCSCWGNLNCFKRVVMTCQSWWTVANIGKAWHYLFWMKMNMEMKNHKEEMIMVIGVMMMIIMMIMMRMTKMSKRLYVIKFIYLLPDISKKWPNTTGKYLILGKLSSWPVVFFLFSPVPQQIQNWCPSWFGWLPRRFPKKWHC